MKTICKTGIAAVMADSTVRENDDKKVPKAAPVLLVSMTVATKEK
jgi:hypothetical protein